MSDRWMKKHWMSLDEFGSELLLAIGAIRPVTCPLAILDSGVSGDVLGVKRYQSIVFNCVKFG